MPPSSSSPADPWPGCQGVRFRPDGLTEGYGSARGIPLLEASIRSGSVEPPVGSEIWRLTGEVDVPGGPIAYDQRLVRTADGAFVVVTNEGSLRVDPDEQQVVVDADRDGLTRQLVTTYGLPLLLQHRPSVLILHACAAVPPSGDGAHVICGSSGAGKSSMLVGLLADGWRAVSEDVCVIDLRDDVAMVWPGPPWVRRADAGPPGAEARFRTPDKTAWDIAPWQVDTAVPVERIVFLEAAGGDEVIWAALGGGVTIARLAAATVWLTEPGGRAAATFEACARIATQRPSARLRLPVAAGWVSRATWLLATDAGRR